MTVDPIGGAPSQLPEPGGKRPDAQKPQPDKDLVDLTRQAATGQKEATYSREQVRQAAWTGPAELTMATDARAQRLAAIRERVQAGVYDTREVIERVVDRLLERWQLGSRNRPDEPGA
jgi:hypothetical protein